MCINPIRIPNPNRGLKHVGLMFMKDTENQFLEVPCGHCPDCVAAKQSAMVQRVQNEARYNHVFFCTLTYDNKHLPYAEIKVPPFKEGEGDQYGTPSLFDAATVAEKLQTSANFVSAEDVEDLLESAVADNRSNFASVPVDVIEEEETPSDWRTIRMAYADIHHIQLLMKNRIWKCGRPLDFPSSLTQI